MESPRNQLTRRKHETEFPEPYPYSASYALTQASDRENDSQISLIDYWAILVKRRWILLTALFSVLTLTAINTWNQTPIYRANLKLQIDVEQANILPFKDYASPDFTYIPTDEYLKTQFEAMSSRSLATRVIRTMKLENDPRFVGADQPTWTGHVVQWVRRAYHVWRPAHSLPVAAPKREDKDQLISPLAASFVSSLTVTPIKDSRVVVVGFDSRDPGLAAQILNTLATEYIQMNFETKYNATVTASSFLEKQLVDLRAQVERSEAELVKFGQEHNIYALGSKENIIMQKLADLDSALTNAQAERIAKESAWKTLVQASPGQFPDSLRNDDIKKLDATVGQLQQQQARLGVLYKPEWPEVKQNANQLAVLEKQLADAKETATKEVSAAYHSAVQREQLLYQAVAAQKAKADTLNKDSIQYSILKREVDSSKQVYDGMLQRMKEADISAGLKSNNIHVVDPAEPPQAPYLPDITANMLKALAGGLLLGIALAFLQEHVSAHLDRSVKTPDDIDRFIRLPFLGLIPSVQLSLPARNLKLAKNTDILALAGGNNGSNNPAGKSTVELVTHYDSKSLISEAYRDLRTSILLSASADRSPKILLVTSSLRGEGKTTTSINLAIALAQANERVLLVDCDLRKPSIHKIFGLENVDGLSGFLSGASTTDVPLTQPTQVPNLFVLPAGRVPPNPSELIGSSRMTECLLALMERFDHILIDSPPLLSVTDARILATIVDGVVLVIKGGETPKEAAIRSRRLLQDVNARILGTMLNKVDFRSSGSYYYSKYYYTGGEYKYGNQGSAKEALGVH